MNKQKKQKMAKNALQTSQHKFPRP